MSRSSTCHICNRPTDNLFEVHSPWSDTKAFCSKDCKNSYQGDIIRFTGLGLFIFAFFLLVVSVNPMMLWISIFGLGIMIYGAVLKNKTKERKVEQTEKFSTKQSSKGMHLYSQEQLIYSNILKTKVRPCCHQSARLNDQYCACGRAIEYPA